MGGRLGYVLATYVHYEQLAQPRGETGSVSEGKVTKDDVWGSVQEVRAVCSKGCARCLGAVLGT